MTLGAAFVGTSGWSYPHWRGTFYPGGLPRDEELAFCAERFGALEINNTFYSLPGREAVLGWRKAVPKGFPFAVKASRYLTHMKKLKDPRQGVDSFFAAVDALGPNLGPVLFQLPPNWRVNIKRLRAFLDALPDGRRFAFEFRDTSWITEETLDLLRERKAAFCIYHLAGYFSPKEVTTDFIYIRLHGPGDKYQGSYPERDLADWAGAISAWTAEGLDVYCFFDNDQEGYAAHNAARLAEMIS
ncbi:DUF72 domain-containing protein [Desulfohalovibrio reitneri]|uniref:DUF72 domain-containing protein n=1 Tax=Desulfohalovibrio reitneri TaxID=1307759 RepID=UPI0004A7007C|nr:DUF72 domain-containing protein [Desulfohalovibrio reitneri]